MSDRLTFRGTVRHWIAALWCEYVINTDPVAEADRDEFVARYLTTFFRLPTLDPRRGAASIQRA